MISLLQRESLYIYKYKTFLLVKLECIVPTLSFKYCKNFPYSYFAIISITE